MPQVPITQTPAPMAPQLKIGSVLRENKTGREGVVVGFDPKNRQAPVVKFPSTASQSQSPTAPSTPSTPPTAPSNPMQQWSEMLLKEINAPAPKFESPASNLSPYARAVEESAELGGQSQAATMRQKQIESAMKSLGVISQAELQSMHGQTFAEQARREKLQNNIIEKLLNGNLNPEQHDAMVKLLQYTEGKFSSPTDWEVIAKPGMGVFRVSRSSGQVVPVMGPKGKQLAVPRTKSGMESSAHQQIQANMAGRQTYSQLAQAINGVLPDYAAALKKAGIQIPQAYPANVNYILEHPQYWDKLPAIKGMIGQAYNALATDVMGYGVEMPESDDAAQQIHLIRAMARRGGTAELKGFKPTAPTVKKSPKVETPKVSVQEWIKSVTGGQ